MKIEEQKKKMQQEEEEANQRVSDYFKSKTKGKTGTFEIFWAIKDDFYKFAEKRGGIVQTIATKIKQKTDKMEEEQRIKDEAAAEKQRLEDEERAKFAPDE